jgi:hypothetical protein
MRAFDSIWQIPGTVLHQIHSSGGSTKNQRAHLGSRGVSLHLGGRHPKGLPKRRRQAKSHFLLVIHVARPISGPSSSSLHISAGIIAMMTGNPHHKTRAIDMPRSVAPQEHTRLIERPLTHSLTVTEAQRVRSRNHRLPQTLLFQRGQSSRVWLSYGKASH